MLIQNSIILNEKTTYNLDIAALSQKDRGAALPFRGLLPHGAPFHTAPLKQKHTLFPVLFVVHRSEAQAL